MTASTAQNAQNARKASPDASLTDRDDGPSPREALVYPFDSVPEAGEARPVAPGVYWIRMPLPVGGLDHINVWAIADGDGWTLVDTGMRDAGIAGLWEQVLAGPLGGRPVRRVIVTHYHPDHVGQAGPLCRAHGARLWMTRTDYFYGRTLSLDRFEEPHGEAESFARACGFDARMMEVWRERARRGFWMVVEPLPPAYRRIVDGERIRIGAHDWEVVVGRGHSPEHACLYCPELGLLISGDQVLPRISSNISVYPTEPDANPLESWIASCRAIPQRVRADVLVLPAHNEPFRGLHERCNRLADRHEAGLDRLAALLSEPRRAIDCFPALFRRRIGDDDRGLATGETLAHLNCLIARGRARRTTDADGVWWYSAA